MKTLIKVFKEKMGKCKKFLLIVLFLCQLIWISSCEKAETDYSISGKVTDSTSALIPGVTISLDGQASKTTNTNSTGNYSFSGLDNGSYTITPSKTGYSFTPISRSIILNNTNIMEQDFVIEISTAVHFIDEPANIPSGVTGEVDNSANRLKVVGVANPSTSRYVFFNSNPIPMTGIKTAIFEADVSLPTGLRTGQLSSTDPSGDQSDNSMGTPVLFRFYFSWRTAVEVSMQSTYGLNLEQIINNSQPLDEISRNGGIARVWTRISNWAGGAASFDPLGLIQAATVGVQFHVRLSVDLEQNKVMSEIEPKSGLEEKFRPLPPGSAGAIAAPFVAVTNLIDYTKDSWFDGNFFFGIAVRTNGNIEVDAPSAPGGTLRYIDREFTNVQVSFNQPIYFPPIPRLEVPSDDFNDGSISSFWELVPVMGLDFVEEDGVLKLSGIPGEDGVSYFSNVIIPRQDLTMEIDFKVPTGLKGNNFCLFRLQFDSFNYFDIQIGANGGYSLIRCINNQLNGIGNPYPLFGDEKTKFHRLKLSYKDATGHVEAFVDNIQLGGIDDELFPSYFTTFQVVFYSFVTKGQTVVREWDNFTFIGSNQ